MSRPFVGVLAFRLHLNRTLLQLTLLPSGAAPYAILSGLDPLQLCPHPAIDTLDIFCFAPLPVHLRAPTYTCDSTLFVFRANDIYNSMVQRIFVHI